LNRAYSLKAAAAAAISSLGDISVESRVPILASLAELAERLSALLPKGEAKECLHLADFAGAAPPGGLQHALAANAERAALAAAKAAAGLSEVDLAQLNSCDSRWLTHARMRWLQLSDEDVVTRMQRYLRQPLTVLEGMVGRPSLGKVARTGQAVIIDAFGDCFLSVYNAKEDNEWNIFHNALRDAVADIGRRCGAHVQTEKGWRRAFDAAKDQHRPADVLLRGSHNYEPAGPNDIYGDLTCVSAVADSYVSAAAVEAGAAAERAAQQKRSDVAGKVPSDGYFLPLAFEADGFTSKCVNALLFGLAKTRADRDDADICARRAWHQHSMDALAHTHARGLARCIMRRAAANLLHMEGSGKRWRPLAQIDVEAALRVVTPDAGGQGRSKRSRRSQG
jgi:hypothetical protein